MRGPLCLSLRRPCRCCAEEQCCCRDRVAVRHSSAGRTSSSSCDGQNHLWVDHPGVVAAAAAEPASAAETAAPGWAATDPAAARPAGWSCFCDDACGADVLATVPDHWLGTDPSSGWGTVGSVVMRALPGTLLWIALVSCFSYFIAEDADLFRCRSAPCGESLQQAASACRCLAFCRGNVL